MKSVLLADSNTTVEPITDSAAYECALKAVEPLLNAEPNTPDYDRAMAMVAAIEDYESALYDLPKPSQGALEEFRRDQRGDAIHAAAA